MNTEITMTNAATGATHTRTLRDSPDWSILVNRLIGQRFGLAAARNRQDIGESEFPHRHWKGIIDGETYTIEEVEPPAELSAITEAATAVSAATEKLEQKKEARDAAVREAIEAGIPAKSVGAASGLSLARVYQIRDGRR